MKRREFIALLGSATVWPLGLHAQQSQIPTIGFLSSASRLAFAPFLAGFRQGLAETGFADGRNVAIEYRWAEGQYDRLPALADDLVRVGVAVIVASGGTAPSLAAKAATTTIPIIFTAVADPVKAGLVASLNRPGGNVTGIDAITAQLDSKRLQLLGSLLPTGSLVGVLINADRPDADIQVRDFQAAGQTVGQQVAVQKVRTEPDIDTAITILVQQRIGALVVAADPFLNSRREQLVALAARHAVPAIYQWREFVTGGGLMSYGPSLADAYRQAGNYAGRILRGEKPADLPVMRPTKFSLVINLKTATALGLTIPQSILLLADEVIE